MPDPTIKKTTPTPPVSTDATGLRVCDPDDPLINDLTGMDTESIGWSKHGRDVDDLYPGSFDPCRQIQWLVGGYVGPNGQDLGYQHGWYVVQELRSVEEGLNGQFSTDDGNKLVCMECHPLLPNDVFIPKLGTPPAGPVPPATPPPETGMEPPPASSHPTDQRPKPPPACNTCHPIHPLLLDLSHVDFTNFTIVLPPMGDNSKGCPTCHESTRPNSLARVVADLTRHQIQPCMTCHLPLPSQPAADPEAPPEEE